MDKPAKPRLKGRLAGLEFGIRMSITSHYLRKQMPEASHVYRNGMVMRDIRPQGSHPSDFPQIFYTHLNPPGFKWVELFFTDLGKIKSLQQIQEVKFITEFANTTKTPEKIPGFKALRQYPGIARIEVAPYRIGVEIIGETIVFKRVLPRAVFCTQFP